MSVDLDDYRTESELVHDASYAALKSTHEKLVHANSAATELKDFSTDNLAVGRHMSLELEVGTSVGSFRGKILTSSRQCTSLPRQLSN